ncbi:MAG: alpha/beta fold hydrolase, partial [Gammaproteobacteria bacterium]|nr:alpha/beta fold hydrolase [Gammaproteobacteria bacterium]
MTDSSPNALQRTLQKTFSLGEGLMGQSRTWIEDWMGRVKGVDDTQLNTFMDMAESYRELLEYLAMHPYRLISAETTLVRQHASLLGNLVRKALGRDVDPVIQPDREDRRFADSDWEDKWLFDYLKQAYLLNAKAVLDIAEHAEGPQVPHHDQLVFYTRQIVNALSPSNFPLTNPEVLRETLSSGGVNLIEGARQFWADFKRNPKLLNISMTDYSAFEVGKNVATTPGKVVFENRLMQLIQYTPSTETVREIPLLILPPWINKFYILDLKPKNSLIKWLVDQGFTVFVVSWVNPGPSYRDTTFDDYIVQGALAAVDAVQRETGAAQVNAIGYCIGGTLLASTLAWLARKGRQPIRSATYLTTLTDFSDPGGIGVFVNEHAISAIEKRLEKTGYFDGRAMAFSFNLLRENDLFWSFFVNNYLKGQKPSAFDLLYWNS